MKLIPQLPIGEVRALASALFARGFTEDQVIEELVAFADALVDWRMVIKGPLGDIAEASDGPLLRAVIRVIVGSLVGSIVGGS